MVLKREGSVDGFGCSGPSLPRGFFSQPSGSSSAEIRRSSSSVEHLENGLEPKCKKQQVHKRTFWLVWTLQPDQTSAFHFDFTPTKILYYPASAREPPQSL